MYIEVSVPETYISTIKVGTGVEVSFPVLGKKITSTVRQTGSYINPNNRSFNVEIPLNNIQQEVKPNMMAKVKITDYISDEAILIPQSVISENAQGEQYAYVATGITKDGEAKVTKRIITTGKTQGDVVEILSGIKTGELIIKEGARSVKEGQEVKIITK